MQKKPTYQELEKELEILKRKVNPQTLLEFSGILFVEINPKGIVTSVNNKTCDVFGYEEKEMIGKNWFENFIPERTKKELLSISKKIISGEIEKIEHFENPILTKNKEERIINWHNSPIKDEKGNILGHLSLGEDITERKKAEQENIKLSTVVEQSSNTIIITDTKGNLEYVNPKFTEVTGYTSEEVLGKNPRFLNSGKYSKEIFTEMWQTMLAGKTWKGEFLNKAKNGEYYWEYQTNTPIKNNTGEITNLLSI